MIVICKNKGCNNRFERNSKWHIICDECLEKSRKAGNKKRNETVRNKTIKRKEKENEEEKTLNGKLMKLIKIKSSIEFKRLWKIVDYKGNVLEDKMRSKATAEIIKMGLKLNPRDDLKIISY